MSQLLRIACAALVVALLVPAAAGASNRRISISNYSWSDPEIDLDLGEHVTWYWTGPDLMHSVTGQPPAAAGTSSATTRAAQAIRSSWLIRPGTSRSSPRGGG